MDINKTFLCSFLKATWKSLLAREKNEGGEVVHIEPRILDLVHSDPTIRLAFE